MRLVSPIIFIAVLGACEPAFIDHCAKTCACTGDSFDCTPPKSGGCDNAWRREWTLASMDGCEPQYVAWFNCVYASSTCTTNDARKSYAPPASACTNETAALRACCSGDKCQG